MTKINIMIKTKYFFEVAKFADKKGGATSGVFIEDTKNEDGIDVRRYVATDGKRLAIYEHPYSESDESLKIPDGGIIIDTDGLPKEQPKYYTNDVAPAFLENNGESSERFFFNYANGDAIACKTINSTFPNYSRVAFADGLKEKMQSYVSFNEKQYSDAVSFLNGKDKNASKGLPRPNGTDSTSPVKWDTEKTPSDLFAKLENGRKIMILMPYKCD